MAARGQLQTIPLAQTGEGIKECELIEWYVQVGCLLSLGDLLQILATLEVAKRHRSCTGRF